VADFAEDSPIIQLKSMEQARKLAEAVRDGKVPDSKRPAAMASLKQFKDNFDPSTGANTQVRTPLPTQMTEFAEGLGLQAPGTEMSQQLLSASKGMGNLGFNTALMGMDALAAVTPDDSELQGFLNESRAATRARRAEFDALARADIVELTGQEPSGVGEFAGQMLPFFALPTALSTYTRTVAFNGLVGALGGGAMNDSAETFQDRVGDMTVGALLGIGTSAVLGAKSGFQTYASRRIAKRFDEDLARANELLEGRIRGLTGNEDFSFSMGQLTGDPFITGLEFGAAHKIQRAAQNNRIDTLVDFLMKRSNALSKRGDVEQIAIDLNDTLSKLSDTTLEAAGTQYARGMDDIMVQYGDDVVLDARGYLDKARELAAEIADPRGLGTPGMVPKGLKDHIEFIDLRMNPIATRRVKVKGEDGKFRVTYNMFDRNTGEVMETFSGRGAAAKALARRDAENLQRGGLNSEDVIEVLKGNRRIASGEVPLFENAALGSSQNLAAALKGSMIESMEGASSGAIGAIQGVRGDYAMSMAKLNRIRNTMLAKVFGDEAAVQNADDALDRLIGRSPQSLKATRDILEKWSPDLLDDIKSTVLRRAVERSRDPSTVASLTETNLNLLAENLAGKSRGVGELGSGLFTVGEQAEIKAVGDAVRVLKETYIDSFSKPSATMLQDASINVISRSPEFMARFLTRIFSTGSSLERAINDPGARRSIISLAKKGPNNDKGRSALAYLTVMMGEQQKEEEAQQRRARLEEAGQRIDPFRQ
jgi:hypothetical protein